MVWVCLQSGTATLSCTSKYSGSRFIWMWMYNPNSQLIRNHVEITWKISHVLICPINLKCESLFPRIFTWCYFFEWSGRYRPVACSHGANFANLLRIHLTWKRGFLATKSLTSHVSWLNSPPTPSKFVSEAKLSWSQSRRQNACICHWLSSNPVPAHCTEITAHSWTPRALPLIPWLLTRAIITSGF